MKTNQYMTVLTRGARRIVTAPNPDPLPMRDKAARMGLELGFLTESIIAVQRIDGPRLELIETSEWFTKMQTCENLLRELATKAREDASRRGSS